MMSISVKKGDAVKIIAGNDNGKSGTVLSVDPSKGKVVVKGEGLSTQKHFVKPRNAQEKGGIVEKERAIDASNVMIICPTCNQATRVAHKIEKNEEGKTVKIRVCKKCGASLDEVKASKAKSAAKKAAPKKTTAKKTTKKTVAEDKE
ncbi:MAG: 50S ribosomal protein L24 [Christensenellales bacterium]